MRMVKALVVACAALFAASTVQAATLVKPAGTFDAASGIELVAAKKAKMAKKPKAQKVAKKGKKSKKVADKSGKCGAYMYYKGGKCMDARAKKG